MTACGTLCGVTLQARRGGPRSRARMLAIDLGAESGRAVVGMFDGDRLDLQEVHRFPNHPVHLGRTLVWDLPALVREVLASIRVAGAARTVHSLGIDGWGVDFGLLDDGDRLLGMPVHYRDQRTEGAVEIVDALVPRAELFAITGSHVHPMNTLYQLTAMARDADPALPLARTLLMIPDLVEHYLTGSRITERTNATTTQCYDITARTWAVGLLDRLGLPGHLLPPVVEPGTSLGRLLPAVADDVGGARLRVIAPATHDTASAVAAIPLDRPASTAWISSGTWSLVGLEVGAPVLHADAFAANVTNEAGLGGRTLLQRSVTGLWLVQQCRRALARAGMDVDHRTLESLAARAPSGTAFVDPDDERFFGPGDLPRAVRGYCRETGQPEPPDAGTMIRVLLESLALTYASSIRVLERVTDQPVDTIHVVGGGARNELLCQLTADAAGLPVRAGPVEAAAIGNVFAQAMVAGLIGSLDEAREVARRSAIVRTYEPAGDWSQQRARFARLTGRATPPADLRART